MYTRFFSGLVLAVLLLVSSGCQDRDIAAAQTLAHEQAALGTPEGWAQALEASQQALDLGDESEATLTLYTLALLENHYPEQAAAAAETALARYPESFTTNYLAAKALCDVGRFRDAAGPAREAHLLRPEHEDALLYHALSAARTGSPQTPDLFARLAGSAFGQSPAYYNELALYYLLREDQPTRAVGVFNEARAANRVSPETYLNLAIVYDEHMNGFPGAQAMAQRYYVKFLMEAGQRLPDKRRQVQQRLRDLRVTQL